jgi:hypothetical protein
MPTQVQFRRGTSTQNDAFLGANGEIAVDLTNKALRVHDGVTTGGWKMSNTDGPIFTSNVVIGNVTALPNSLTVGNSSVNTVSNSSGLFTTGTVNGATISVGSVVVANSTTLNANGLIVNSTGTYVNGIINASSHTTGGGYGTTTGGVTVNSTVVAVGNSSVNMFSNSSTLYIGNSIVYSTANATNKAVVNSTGQVIISATQVAISANASSNLVVGNSSVNTTINSTSISVSNASIGNNISVTNNLTVTGNTYLAQVNTGPINTGAMTVSGNVTITGNLVVTGNVVSLNVQTLSVVDNMIYLNSNNNTANPDLGFAGNYNDGIYHHAGFFRDATDGVWKVFDNYLPEPDVSPYIDTTNTTFHVADFQANTLYLGNTSTNWLISNGSGLYHTGTINAVSHTVGSSWIANSSGSYHTGTMNAATHSVGSIFVANATTLNANGFVVNSSTLSSNSFLANSTGAYVTGLVNAASYNVGSNFIANSTGIYTTGAINAVSVAIGTNWTVNSTGAYHTGTINAASFSVGTVFTTNSTLTNTVSLVVSTNTSTFGTAAYVVANGNIGIGNSTPANKLVVNGTTRFEANLVTSNTVNILANGAYGTAGQVLASNGTTVYWATLGGASAVGGSNTQIQFNTSAALDANANFTWVNPTRTMWANGYINVQNSISVGTGVAPTTGNTTYVLVANGSTYFNGNLVIASGGIQANGGYGTAGQALLSNGSAVYWATATAGSNTYIQFNDSGAAGATSDFTYNKANKWLYVANAIGIGAGLTSPAAALHANGSGYFTADVISSYSDERLKDISGPIDNALDKVSAITGFYYTPNKTALNMGVEQNQLSRVGVSAQEIRKVLPEVVKDAPIGQGYLTVQYDRIVPLLIEAIKELREEIRVLKETK